MTLRVAGAIVCLLVLAGCGTQESQPEAPAPEAPPATEPQAPTSTAASSDQTYPDVIEVEVTEAGDDLFDFDVTISSPYDSPDRYADAWRVLGSDGTVFGIRELLHDHSAEQPFTRSLTGIEIPSSITEVTVEARDLVNGWGGKTQTVVLPDRDT